MLLVKALRVLCGFVSNRYVSRTFCSLSSCLPSFSTSHASSSSLHFTLLSLLPPSKSTNVWSSTRALLLSTVLQAFKEASELTEQVTKEWWAIVGPALWWLGRALWGTVLPWVVISPWITLRWSLRSAIVVPRVGLWRTLGSAVASPWVICGWCWLSGRSAARAWLARRLQGGDNRS